MTVRSGDALFVRSTRLTHPPQSLQGLRQLAVSVALIVRLIQVGLQFASRLFKSFEFEQFISQSEPHGGVVWVGGNHLFKEFNFCFGHVSILL